MKFSMLSQTVGMLNLTQNLFCTSNIQGRELYLCDLIKHTFGTGPRPDTTNRFVSNLV